MLEAVGYDLCTADVPAQAVMEAKAKRFRKTSRHLLILIMIPLSHLPTLKMRPRTLDMYKQMRRYRMRMNMVRCWMS